MYNTTSFATPPSADYDILQGAVALLVGFLIFFSIGWRFELVHHILRGQKVISHFSFDSLLLLTMVITAAASGIFSLLSVSEVFEFTSTRAVATVFFIVSLISISVFVFSILNRPPPPKTTGDTETSL